MFVVKNAAGETVIDLSVEEMAAIAIALEVDGQRELAEQFRKVIDA